MPHHFSPGGGMSTIPGGGVIDRPNFSTQQDSTALHQHYNLTMRQVQAGLNTDSNTLPPPRDSVSGGLDSTTSLTPSIAGVNSAVDQSLLRPDTLSGGLAPQLVSSTQEAAWLQRAELVRGEASDTISAAGPDAARHMENISVKGSPYFMNGTVQDTIQAVGVTVSGGATPFSDTISGTLHGFGQAETSPFNSYSPLPLKDEAGKLLYPKEGILPEGNGNDSLHPSVSDKAASLDPQNKVENKASLVDLLHQVDHQVTIDLGKHSGVASPENISNINSFNPDSLKNTLAHTDDKALLRKNDDSLVTLLDEEEKKRMATNINLSGPFGGNH